MTYVLSDIHGNLQRFKSIMALINLQTNDTLYVLGDVIDRYAGGIKILRQIMRMPNAEMLIGKGDNAIGIDCGSGYEYGRLSCLRLDDMKEFYSDC